MEPLTLSSHRVDPVLRWAGGKRWLVSRIRQLIGKTEINGYFEPFLGGASVFFGLEISDSAHLSDMNDELIEFYRVVREDPAGLAEALEGFENSKESYYAARASTPTSEVGRAARFLYLNHTSFNGIYRVNLRGEYNVPFGNRPNPLIPDIDRLRRASSRLQGASIESCDFEATLEDVKEGDLVFLDPPYTVAHNNNGFVKYNQKLFSFDDQHRLSLAIDRVKAARAYYILTNAAHDSIRSLFAKGDRSMLITRGNSIGGRAARRGSEDELLFTNLPCND